jgi:hypothetical protein
VSTRPPTYTPIVTGQEVVDRNLRAIQEAFTRISQAAAVTAAAAAYVHLGALTGGGTITVPANARRVRALATGETKAAGTINVQVNSVVAGYSTEIPAGSAIYVGPSANWPLYVAPGAVNSFTAWADVTYGPGAAPQAFIRGEAIDVLTSFRSIDGNVGCPLPISSLTFVVANMNQIAIDLWAELPV